ncbi:uncharacterized protein LOC142240164 [Haematobia irritans]|uniref:uncharacterized protein LOC142240164 n=1 Tax=Haematobia irritans TaxID=7368 RepID=UPI003F4F9183
MQQRNKIKLRIIKCFILMGLMATNFVQINGKQLKLLPLSASQVYHVLRESRNLDAIPEGRIITEGIAAATGFSMGLATGLGGLFLLQIATANITEPDGAARTDSLVSEAADHVYKSEEVCFNARLARSLEEYEGTKRAFENFSEKGRSLQPIVIHLNEEKPNHGLFSKGYRIGRKKRTQGKRRKKFSKAKRRRHPKPAVFDGIRFITTTDALNADYDEEARSALNIDTGMAESGTGSNANDDDGLESTISTRTSSDNDDTVTCIVVKKPKQ